MKKKTEKQSSINNLISSNGDFNSAGLTYIFTFESVTFTCYNKHRYHTLVAGSYANT